MNRWSRTRTIFLKELVDNLRDRRSWVMAALYVVLGPLMLLVIIALAGRVLANETTRELVLPVIGAERAPALMEELKQHNIAPRSITGDPARMLQQDRYAAILVVSNEYGGDLVQGRPASVRLFFDSSRGETLNQVNRVHEVLRGYSTTVGYLRLMARGIEPNVVRAIAVEDADTATPYSRASFLFASIPIFLLMSLFVGSLYIAIDTTAGERERGSLEPLLLNPLSVTEVVLGKLGAIAVFGVATVCLAIVGFALVLNFAPHDIPQVRLGLSTSGLFWLLAILLPATLLAAALQIRLASACRTYKEAQTAGQFLMLIPALPGIVEQLGTVELSRVKYVPIVSQHWLITRVLNGDAVPLGPFGVASFAAIALGALLIVDTIRCYHRGRILFG